MNIIADKLLPRIGAHVLVVARNDHARKSGDVLCHGRAVDHARNIVAAVANIETDSDVAVRDVRFH